MLSVASEKEALLEAWLIDGTYLKEGEKYEVLTVDEAKDAIQQLVERGDYTLARKLAEGLRNKVSISAKEVLRSYRVSFAAYLGVVQAALEKSASLGSAIKDLIAEDLAPIVDSIQAREIPNEKRELVKMTFEKWMEQLPTQSSHTKEEYVVSLTLAADDIPETIAKVCQAELLTKARTQLSKVPKVLERYLEAVGVREPEDENGIMNIRFNPQLFRIRLKTSEERKLKISLTFENSLENSEMSSAEFEALDNELRKDFGDDAVHELYEVDEGFFTSEGPSFEVELFSGLVEFRSRKLLLNNVEVASYPPSERYDFDKIKGTLLKDYTFNVEQRKMDLKKFLQADRYDKIVDITEELNSMQTRLVLADFSLDVIAKLLQRKTQVISLRAPEMLILIWEAKKPNRFESFVGVEDD